MTLQKAAVSLRRKLSGRTGRACKIEEMLSFTLTSSLFKDKSEIIITAEETGIKEMLRLLMDGP